MRVIGGNCREICRWFLRKRVVTFGPLTGVDSFNFRIRLYWWYVSGFVDSSVWMWTKLVGR